MVFVFNYSVLESFLNHTQTHMCSHMHTHMHTHSHIQYMYTRTHTHTHSFTHYPPTHLGVDVANIEVGGEGVPCVKGALN